MIDSHCHLYFKNIRDNIDIVIKNSKKNNIECLLSINTSLEDFDDHLNLLNRFNCTFISYGLHPTNVNNLTNIDINNFIEKTHNKKVIGIGETGLDFYHSTEFKTKQYEVFETHIDASINTKLPLIIHQRNSENEIIDIINSFKNYNLSIVFHSFTGTKKLLNFCLDNNYYISLSGIVTFKNANNLREVIKHSKLKNLLIETDSPFLAPVPMRGKSNEPSFLKYTAEYLSDFFGISFQEFVKITDNNFYKLFSKAKRYNDFE